jgi:hypothetical protein
VIDFNKFVEAHLQQDEAGVEQVSGHERMISQKMCSIDVSPPGLPTYR